MDAARCSRITTSKIARGALALVRALLYSRVERNVSLSCRPVEMSDRCVSVSVCVCVAKSFSNEFPEINFEGFEKQMLLLVVHVAPGLHGSCLARKTLFPKP